MNTKELQAKLKNKVELYGTTKTMKATGLTWHKLQQCLASPAEYADDVEKIVAYIEKRDAETIVTIKNLTDRI